MLSLALPVLAASLLGSPHCAAMCGPFACLYAGQTEQQGAWRAHAAYNLGRLGAYLFLGAVAGLAGAGLNQIGALAGLPRVAAVVAGALMVLWGGLTIAAAYGARVPGTSPPAGFRRMLSQVIARFKNRPPTVRALALGLFTTLLPCGWLYAFVAVAAGTGAVMSGMLVMSAFWLGTLPVMAGVGLLAQRALGPFRRRLPIATAAVLVVLGVLTMAGRLSPDLSSTPASPGVHAGH
ncbi:MAG: sulfite exporter TauE/SafE family protein [Gemmatimonadales bacterium]